MAKDMNLERDRVYHVQPDVTEEMIKALVDVESEVKKTIKKVNGKVPDTQGNVNIEVTEDLLASMNLASRKDIESTAAVANQVDFVKLLQQHNPVSPKIKARVLGDRRVEASISLGGNKVAVFTVEKDVNDDFMKFQGGALAEIEETDVIYDYESYEGTSGVWVKLANNSNHYTREVGATAYGTITGTGLDISTYANNQGGVWEVSVNGEVVKTYSTHVGAYNGNTSAIIPIVKGLPEGEHTWSIRFLGDDPGYPPVGGAGTSRGWFRSPSTLTVPSTDKLHQGIWIYTLGLAPAKYADVLFNSSNKEFAFSCTPLDEPTGTYNWFPDHGVGTAFAGVQKVYFDDKLITNWNPMVKIEEVSVVKVVQRINMKFPNASSPHAEAFVVHTINATGVSYKVNWKWLRNTRVASGYVHMLPVHLPFVEKLRTSLGNTYLANKIDGSRTYLMKERDQASSYVYFNESGEDKYKDIAVAMTVFDTKSSFRQGATGRLGDNVYSSMIWLEHRNASMQKLYPQVYDKHDAFAGDEHSFGATVFIGLLPYAAELLK